MNHTDTTTSGEIIIHLRWNVVQIDIVVILLISRKSQAHNLQLFTRITGHDIHIMVLNLSIPIIILIMIMIIGHDDYIIIIYGDEAEIAHQIVGDD